MIAKVIVFMAITILLALGEYLYLYKQYSQKKILLFCILSGVIGFVSTQILLWHYQVAYFLVKNGVGMGDIKLILLMSLYLGIQGIFGVLFMSLIVIFFAGLYLMIIKKRSKREAIPFAPAILAGTVISILVNGI